MGTGRRVFEFLKMASIAHAKWDYEVSMNILKRRKSLWILFIMLLPIIVVTVAGAGDMLGSKTAYAPAFYSTNIFLISIAIGLCAGLITGCIGAGGGFILSTGDQCGRDTPDANILKLVEVARTYGRYA